MEKKTKATYFAELREMIIDTVTDQEHQDELLDFIDKQIEILEKRKVAAAERAEKKRTESDALTKEILEYLTYDLATVDEIVAALGDETITRNKVTARLGKLVRAGLVEKEMIKVDDAKRMAYRLCEAETTEEE